MNLVWNEIKTYFYDSLERYFIVKELTTQREALIGLIHRKGDWDINLRPISLTNCDYKIQASVLAKRF